MNDSRFAEGTRWYNEHDETYYILQEGIWVKDMSIHDLDITSEDIDNALKKADND